MCSVSIPVRVIRCTSTQWNPMGKTLSSDTHSTLFVYMYNVIAAVHVTQRMQLENQARRW